MRTGEVYTVNGEYFYTRTDTIRYDSRFDRVSVIWQENLGKSAIRFINMQRLWFSFCNIFDGSEAKGIASYTYKISLYTQTHVPLHSTLEIESTRYVIHGYANPWIQVMKCVQCGVYLHESSSHSFIRNADIQTCPTSNVQYSMFNVSVWRI